MLKIIEGIGQKPTEQEVVLTRTTITNVCESIFDVLLDELPEEAHTIEAFDYILSETQDMIHSETVKFLE